MLALILLATGFITASAASDADHGTNVPGESDVKKYARITITRTDDAEMVHPQTKLKFTIIVERLIDGHAIAAGTNNLYGPDGATGGGATDDDDASVEVLDDENPYRSYNVEYTITTADLGAGVASRTVPLKWTFSFQIADEADGTSNPHPASAVTITETIDVDVTKRPDASVGDSGVSIVFDVTEPEEIAKGKEVKFAFTVSTGANELLTKSVIVKKQLKDADGEKVGNALPVAVVSLPALQSNAVSDAVKTTPESYKLLQSEVDALADGGTLEFSYELQLTEVDVQKDINGDGDFGVTSADPPVPVTDLADAATIATHDNVEKLSDTYVLGSPPAPEPTAVPPIGMNDAATVDQGPGNRIDVTLADGSEFSLFAGYVAADGVTRSYHRSGYIRDNDLGQTYAVVRRDADGMVVRVWIPAGSTYVNEVPWANVLANFTVDTMVVEAIPLDEMYPVDGQLVRNTNDDRIYVYVGGEWRWIPDIPTFQAWSFYWCNITAADAGFFDRVTTGNPLPRSGTQDDANYPVCHS